MRRASSKISILALTALAASLVLGCGSGGGEGGQAGSATAKSSAEDDVRAAWAASYNAYEADDYETWCQSLSAAKYGEIVQDFDCSNDSTFGPPTGGPSGVSDSPVAVVFDTDERAVLCFPSEGGNLAVPDDDETSETAVAAGMILENGEWVVGTAEEITPTTVGYSACP